MPRKRLTTTDPTAPNPPQAIESQVESPKPGRRSTRSVSKAVPKRTKAGAAPGAESRAPEAISAAPEPTDLGGRRTAQIIATQAPVMMESEAAATAEDSQQGAVSLRERIALLAYSYWETRGRQGGSPEEDWLRAEQEIQRQISPDSRG